MVGTMQLLQPCTKFPLPTALQQQRHGPRLLPSTAGVEAFVVADILHGRLRNYTRDVFVG